ncbi:conserved hypothetical protein [Rhodospirillaceae bacterium LM-1]|nr:conserved hypothetical protein [Rhodospirillaceae bacterium LM-1]
MAKLSASQQAFVRRMAEGEEFERHGVDLLVQRNDFEQFFDALAETGLFNPTRNPQPLPADTVGYFRIPYWHILDYLKAVAKRSGDESDLVLAEKVMEVIRTVSRTPATDGTFADNYHTTRVFAEILSLVPTRAVTMNDIDLVPLWFGGRFPSMVGSTLAGGLLRHFVDSADPDDWQKACRLLHHATAIQWKDEKELGEGRRAPHGVVEDYWLKKLVNEHASAFGSIAGNAAATILLDRVREAYSEDLDERASWLSRPAIEDHQQNHSCDGIVNIVVEGLRDVLLSWTEKDSPTAKAFIVPLLNDKAQIVRRIAIHLVDEKFAVFRDIVLVLLSPSLFEPGHLHETYRFLKSHFGEFTPEEKKATFDAICALTVEGGDDANVRLRRLQRLWLSAIEGKGSTEAGKRLTDLRADKALGGMSSHPDFHTYMESHWGFGDSPYTVQQLQAFADDGSLIDALNAFTPMTNSWNGPTKRALVDALAEAVVASPERFLPLLPKFSEAKREYQCGVISGFKKLWDVGEERMKLNWDDAWPKLLNFFFALITPFAFWEEAATEDEDLSPNRNWIPPLISGLLEDGTRDDKTAFHPDLLQQAWTLVVILLQRSSADMGPDPKDSMNRAINSSKGRAVEAMINCALRICRVEHEATGTHEKAWLTLQPAFDAEVAQCKNANYEFSTIAASNISQLRYLSAEWTKNNFSAIFPLEIPANCLCALGGLSYSPATAVVYADLVEFGVLDWALRQDKTGEHARATLLQRIGLAYLWGHEQLDGLRFTYLFDERRADDLIIIASYLFSVSRQELEGNHVEKILAFWERCVAWARSLDVAPTKLLSALGPFSCYLSSVGEREHGLLVAVAPHVAIYHNADRFLEALERLALGNEKVVSEVFGQMLTTYKPSFDIEGRIKSILTTLAQCRATHVHALKYADQLMPHLPNMLKLYEELSNAPQS